MAIAHLQFGNATPHAQLLRSHLNGWESSIEGLVKDKATMQTMIDGDGSDASQFAEVAIRYNVIECVPGQTPTAPQLAAAKGLWDEINSALFKETTDASVTNLDTARKQLMNKTR